MLRYYIATEKDKCDSCPNIETSERSYDLGEGNGNPLQCSCLENPRDGEPGGLQSMGSQSQTQLKRLSSSSSMSKYLLRL